MKSVAILLTVHNRREKTLKCLRCVFHQLPIEGYVFDVYMTNDGCTDGTPDAVSNEFPSVTIIDGDGSLYWNRGMYVAWSKAEKTKDYDYYLWLNDDTYLFDDSLEKLLKSSQSHTDDSIIVGSSCSADDHDFITYGGISTKKGRITDVRDEHKCDTFEGNIILIPKYVYNTLGKNDQIFHHAVGDNDYGYRATKAGISIYMGKGVFGTCEQHDKPAKWNDSNMPLSVRWKDYFSPYSSTYKEYFILRRRHFGTLSACIKFITSFLHMLIPSVYNKLKY